MRPSLNGVYVNGVRLGEGKFVELFTGDEVLFVCANEFDSSFNVKIGFVLERVVHSEEVSFTGGKEVGRGNILYRSLHDDRNSRAGLLLSQCKKILSSIDPISYIVKCVDMLKSQNDHSVMAYKRLGHNVEIPAS